MTIKMTSLKRDKNGDWFARKGIPSAVRESYKLAFGRSQEERFRRPAELPVHRAKIEFSDWLAEVEERIERLRASNPSEIKKLSMRQQHALIGRWYEWFTAKNDEHIELPLEALESIHEGYLQVVDSVAGPLSSLDIDREEAKERSPRHAARVAAFIATRSEIDIFLASEGITLVGDEKAELLAAMEGDFDAALYVLKRRAGGDYGPDQRVAKYPRPTPFTKAPASETLAGLTIWGAFEGWVKERQPAVSTVNRWRGVFENLDKYHEGRDIVLFSDANAVEWKNALVGDGRGTRTINEIWLSSARTVFEWVRNQKKIADNPFDGLKVAGGKKVETRDREFTDEEISTLLNASLKPVSQRTGEKLRAAYRWVPWLCAYTGARSGEITQLRKQDFHQHKDGFWFIEITPDAGTVKGGSFRKVPLHSHLIEQGVIEFVRQSSPGPLFHDGTKAKTIDPLKPPRPAHVVVRNKLGAWVRKQGVTDKRISPNHAWRHTFKRRAARAGIEQRIRDAMCGHSDGRVGALYETPTLQDMACAMVEFQRYKCT
ncbi:Site-specific recombinase XerD [Aliiroseovarius halocynthiae]|uniref:Tyrosine-type recombinase/integrase n=1 Tax=Aliiroseovarius halocynthiae TaxID=985055 RepID=A0A545SR87_9RHOB|nr:tyrosine-type recombinase/integrase [Aliiroseovarius halocynthiae]TQV67490.1 tyrosine-type recombinase/integrase [Aliiroseovarius halocynthiae]SMR81499.1 Site-specific recombinase XerD [Aliiroseovarius halocynthiae]